MPVQIEQLDVLPAPAGSEGPAAKPAAPAQTATPPNPQLAHEIAVTVAHLRSRELRLWAD